MKYGNNKNGHVLVISPPINSYIMIIGGKIIYIIVCLNLI